MAGTRCWTSVTSAIFMDHSPQSHVGRWGVGRHFTQRLVWISADKHVTNHAVSSMDRRLPSGEDHNSNTFYLAITMGFNFQMPTRTNGFINYSTFTHLHDHTAHRQWHWRVREANGSKQSTTVPYPKPPNSGTRSKIFSKRRSQIFPLRQKGTLLWPNIFWSLRVRIPVGARFSAPAQTGHGAHPASYTMGTGSFPGAKRPTPI